MFFAEPEAAGHFGNFFNTYLECDVIIKHVTAFAQGFFQAYLSMTSAFPAIFLFACYFQVTGTKDCGFFVNDPSL